MSLLRRAQRLCEGRTEKQNIVAFCVRKGQVSSTGFNSYTKTHPRQRHFARLAGQPQREYLHAEIAALLRADHDIDSIHVFRFDVAGRAVCAKPCPVCMLAIRRFSSKLKVYHT